jgi:large subunit ribosomal protein L16
MEAPGSLHFGQYGLTTSEPGRVTARQLEAIRRVLSRGMNRQGKVWFRTFPHTAVTDKPKETRMGKGKGVVDYWCARVPAGTVLLEVAGIQEDVAREVLRKSGCKRAVTSTVTRRDRPLV